MLERWFFMLSTVINELVIGRKGEDEES